MALEYLASVMTIASESVDRLEQVPPRLSVLFSYSAAAAMADATIRSEMSTDGARTVARAFADELASRPRLERETFRAAANAVKTRTGQKGRALFHPIRVVLTGHAEGPELDLIVPAIDRGAELPMDSGVPKIIGCRERAAAFVAAVDLSTHK
jgi:glutamyl/glutaminyl-tRNA synthetase